VDLHPPRRAIAMSVEPAFAPYRLAPGALPEEAARAAAEAQSEPLVAGATEPLPGPLVNRALADVPAGRAPSPAEACRAADGSIAGGGGPPRACLSSARQRARVADVSRAALAAGFAGVCLDRPDAPLALGLLGAGFCPDCQRDLGRHLAREYGEHFQPVDYLALARAAIAQASGAISYEQLPFGRDFWRVRHEALPRAIAEYARDARDAARGGARPFQVVAQFEAVGSAQLRSARHLDAAIFPAHVSAGASGIGLARLLRAAMGRRACALALPADLPAATVARAAAIAGTCGIDLSGVEPAGQGGRDVAAVRRLARRLQAHALSPAAGEPGAECAILFSAEADLWSGGRHRAAVERAAEALAALHVQAPVVLRVQDAPAGAALVLADAAALSSLEAKQARRRLETGGPLLAFGEPGAVDELGRPAPRFHPLSGKASGTRVGEGTLAMLPALGKDGGTAAPDPALLEKALAAVLGRGRRAASVAARVPLVVVLHRNAGALVAHLVAPEERAQGATLFLGVHVAGGARRARFVSADGQDLRIPMNPSGNSVSTVLPAFRGYAVLSVGG
jgi:hypothetical protein